MSATGLSADGDGSPRESHKAPAATNQDATAGIRGVEVHPARPPRLRKSGQGARAHPTGCGRSKLRKLGPPAHHHLAHVLSKTKRDKKSVIIFHERSFVLSILNQQRSLGSHKANWSRLRSLGLLGLPLLVALLVDHGGERPATHEKMIQGGEFDTRGLISKMTVLPLVGDGSPVDKPDNQGQEDPSNTLPPKTPPKKAKVRVRQREKSSNTGGGDPPVKGEPGVHTRARERRRR